MKACIMWEWRWRSVGRQSDVAVVVCGLLLLPWVSSPVEVRREVESDGVLRLLLESR